MLARQAEAGQGGESQDEASKQVTVPVPCRIWGTQADNGTGEREKCPLAPAGFCITAVGLCLCPSTASCSWWMGTVPGSSESSSLQRNPGSAARGRAATGSPVVHHHLRQREPVQGGRTHLREERQGKSPAKVRNPPQPAARDQPGCRAWPCCVCVAQLLSPSTGKSHRPSLEPPARHQHH